VCLVDREEGGSRELRERGYDVRPVFTVGDVRQGSNNPRLGEGRPLE